MNRNLIFAFLLGALAWACTNQSDSPASAAGSSDCDVVLTLRYDTENVVCTDGDCCPDGFDFMGYDAQGATVCAGHR